MAAENVQSVPLVEGSLPVTATCHCGNITVVAPHRPVKINECQCTICRRYASAWAYYNPRDVKITITDPSADSKYIWGDKEIEFHFCRVCGCVMHWLPIADGTKMGVNTRAMKPEDTYLIDRKISYHALWMKLHPGSVPHAESMEEKDSASVQMQNLRLDS